MVARAGSATSGRGFGPPGDGFWITPSQELHERKRRPGTGRFARPSRDPGRPPDGRYYKLNFPCFASLSRRFTSSQLTTFQKAAIHSARRFSYCR